jgi:hypothetical protein
VTVGGGSEQRSGCSRFFPQSSQFLLNQSSNVFDASQYGAIFLNHDSQSIIQSGGTINGSNLTLYGVARFQECSENSGDYLDPRECQFYGTGIGYTVSYNFTALHSAVSESMLHSASVLAKWLNECIFIQPLFQVLGDEGIVRQALGRSAFTISAKVAPLKLTNFENSFAESAAATNLWFLIVL